MRVYLRAAVVLCTAITLSQVVACGNTTHSPSGDEVFASKVPSVAIANASDVPGLEPLAHDTCTAMSQLPGSYSDRTQIVVPVLIETKKLTHQGAGTFIDITSQAYCPNVPPAVDPTPMPDQSVTVATAKTRREAACITIKALTPGVLESRAATRILADPSATTTERTAAMKTVLDQEATDPRLGDKTPYECDGPVFDKFVAEQILSPYIS